MPRKTAAKNSQVAPRVAMRRRAPKGADLYELVGRTKEGLPLYLPKGSRTALFDRVGVALAKIRTGKKKPSISAEA